MLKAYSGGNLAIVKCSSFSYGGSALFPSTIRARSPICVPFLASASAASLPRTPVCERTCSMRTASPLSCCSCRYASRNRNARSLLVTFGPLRGRVLPVAMCIAYLLSTLKTVTPSAPASPWIARSGFLA